MALILLGAIGIGWYNENLRALGKVGSLEIGPAMLRDKVRLETYRINRDEGRVTQAQIAGQLTADEADAKNQALQTRSTNLSTTALDTLVDTIYQSQLAPDNGVTVADTDIQAAYEQEISDPEQRHVYITSIAPQAADEAAGPTAGERSAARDKANQALADLQAGKDFSQVAQTYGTDDKSRAGGDYGTVAQIAIGDETLGDELFKLAPGGTTGVVLGDDGTYRIGRVTDVVPGAESTSLKTGCSKTSRSRTSSSSWATRSRRSDCRTRSSAMPSPRRRSRPSLPVIYIAGLASGDTNTTDGEIDYYQMVLAPNKDPENAPNLAPDDPAWAEAKTRADATIATFQAITDVEQRMSAFQSTATKESDDETSQDGGHVEYTTRDIPPQEVSDALWNGTHAKGDLIGPIKGDSGYYILMYNDKRASAEERIQQVKDALAQPNADFAALAKQYSDGPEKDEGGEIGWFTRESLSSEIADKVFGLSVGQVSDPIELGQGQYFIKLEDKQNRPLDADQQAVSRQSAFSTWYEALKTQATTDGTITTITPLSSGDDLTTGGDQPPQ